MADLKGSECLSVEECVAVFQDHTGWEWRLVRKAAMKESYIVEKIASVADKYVPSSKEARQLKGIGKIDVLSLTMCIFALCTGVLCPILDILNENDSRYQRCAINQSVWHVHG